MTLFIIISVLLSTAMAKYSGPTNQAGINLIKEFEGFKENFYTDPVYGIRTIGYGHACHIWNCKVSINGKYSVPLTPESGEKLLKEDLKGYEECVKKIITTHSNLNVNQFSALVSFTFNLGCGSLRSSTLRTLLNKGNVYGASKEFGRWIRGGGRVLPSLIRRREAERTLFCSGGLCGGSGISSNSVGHGNRQCVGKITASTLNIRAGPNTFSNVVGSLRNGSVMNITNRVSGASVLGNSNWFKIPAGYVSAYYVRINGSNGQSWCVNS